MAGSLPCEASVPSSSMAPWRFSGGPYFSVTFFESFCAERSSRSSLVPPRPNLERKDMCTSESDVLAHVAGVELVELRRRRARCVRGRWQHQLQHGIEIAA